MEVRKQKYFLSILFFLALYSACISQTLKRNYWENINYSSKTITGLTYDSTVIIATNRVFDTLAEGGSFLGNQVNEKNKLRYFVSTKVDGQWQTFLQPSLDSAVRFLPKDRSIVLFVHGDGKSFPVLLNRSMAIQSIYHVSVIAFDYPSYLPGASSLKNFYNSRKNVKQSLGSFGTFLSDTKTTLTLHPDFSGKPKTLFFHSLGNYLLREYIKSEDFEKSDTNWVENVLLNAGAVKQRNHKKWLKRFNHPKRIYVTSNKKDYTLKGSMIITFSKQLGGNIKGPLYKEANYINFTSIADKAHNCFLDINLLQGDNKLRFFYKEVLNGKQLNLSDSTRFSLRKDCLGYDLK